MNTGRQHLDGNRWAGCNLQRIAVVGTSCAGKSTLSRELAGILGQRHVELDHLYWGPNWTPKPEEEFELLLEEAVAHARWVVDGNYSTRQDAVLRRATTVIWLNYPFVTVFRRALFRSIRRALFAEELFSGNRETFAKSFFSKESIIWWVITTYGRRLRQYRKLREENRFPQLEWVELCTPRQAERFLREIGCVGKAKQEKEVATMGSECSCGCGEAKKILVKVEWQVPGIKCEGCAQSLTTALEGVAGVLVEEVNVEKRRVVVSYNAALTSEGELKEAFGKAGFPVTSIGGG
ncbi:MAG TPA: cation transporter [Geobacteraceae bacterium]